ncbi:hypothetical protein TKK_0004334 [Trichogramma kaykai]|uniref:tRNA (uracil(54)-C(5))-methyltransferase n=1 Tax=Trichogramma kaykai TaxID=54128 RepID=A0ABD2XLM7_9HYME
MSSDNSSISMEVADQAINDQPKSENVDKTSNEEQSKSDNVALETDQKDLYAYLDHDFTTERFKLEVRGLPKFYGFGEFRKFLNEKLQLDASKIKPPKRGSGWAYICFRSEKSRDDAIKALHGVEWKKAKLSAQVAKPAPDPFIKRKMERKNAKPTPEDPTVDMSPETRVRLSTTPLYDMPYADQLKSKQKEIGIIVKTMCQQILNVNEDLKGWFDKQRKRYEGFPCELGEIVHSNTTDGYRNKCEFTIGMDVTGTKKMIGFRLASYASGSVAIGPIDELRHIPQKMKTAIKILEKFICDSDLAVFDPTTHQGYWKLVTARTTRLDHLMLIIGINPQSMTEEDLKNLQKKLKEFFEEPCNAEVGVTSLYFQTIVKKEAGGKGGGEIVHLSGSHYIEEQLLGMTFRISPEAFFQVNTLAAEELYKTAIELAKPLENTALLDVCCGTGTIGLSFAKHCDEVFGIEMIPTAIHDAKVNATQNTINNSEFFIGKAEDLLIPVINRTTQPNIVAIVDPPRAGLHQRALIALRKAKKLNKLVYISCDPKAAIKNLVDLARPNSKQYHGDPLVPVKAVPVDMFPHTKHCELIIYLERFSLIQKREQEKVQVKVNNIEEEKEKVEEQIIDLENQKLVEKLWEKVSNIEKETNKLEEKANNVENEVDTFFKEQNKIVEKAKNIEEGQVIDLVKESEKFAEKTKDMRNQVEKYKEELNVLRKEALELIEQVKKKRRIE